MKIIFLENNKTRNLYPITLTRRACDILCGGTTLADLAMHYFSKIRSNKILYLDPTLVPSVAEMKALAAKARLGKNLAADWPRFNHIWEVITFNQKLLRSNLELLYKKGIYRGKNVRVNKHVILDDSAGPVVIGDNVEIAPFVHLVGPLFIGPNSKVNEFSVLKHSSIGPVCKVGGELDATVIQGYSNKQHQGVLAHSYVGEWVNLGGGTANSDLKNTYGPVKMAGENTGELFLGCVISDHCKTAINTAIFTGKVIGVNSTLFGFVTRDVPSFTNYLGQLGSNVEFSLDQAIKVQKIVMARRNVKQTKAHVDLLKNVFKTTQAERNQAKIRKGKLIFK